MQNNIKNRKLKILFSRLLAITLAIATVITTVPPIEAHAETIGSTTDAGGNEGGGKDFKVGVGNNYMGWYSQTQGYRIYIINSSFERISPIYDFSLGRSDLNDTGWQRPDIWYKANVTEDDDTVYKWETRFDTDNSPTSGNQSWSFEKFQEWCTYTDSSISDLNYTAKLPPVIYRGYYNSEGKKQYAGNGTAFKEWFFAGQGGTNIQTGGTNKGQAEEDVNTQVEDGKTLTTATTPTDTPTTADCAKCQGEGKIECKICGGTGEYPYAGPDTCPSCIGYGYSFCTECNEAVKCSFCGRDITRYQTKSVTNRCIQCWFETEHDGICNRCGAEVPNSCTKTIDYAVDCYTDWNHGILNYSHCDNCVEGLLTCSNCGKGYEEGSECSYCKCVLCNSQMTMKSEGNFYCSTCNRNVTYNTNTGTIRIAVPTSYWLESSRLNPSTIVHINFAKTLINTSAEYTPGSYYYSNLPTLGSMITILRDQINSEFRTKFDSEDRISPHDALLYATGLVAYNTLSALPDDTTAEHKQAMSYILYYYGYKYIKESQEYLDLYYTEMTLTSSQINTQSIYAHTSLLTTQIPLASEDAEYCEVHKTIHEGADKSLCDLSQTGGLSPYKVLAMKPDAIQFPNGEYTSALEALNDGCYLIVEPLIGVRIHLQENHGDSHGDDGYETHWTYGSFWNIAQEEWASDGKSNWYNSYVMDLAPNCLVTTKEVKSVTDDGIELVILPAQDPDASKKISVSRNQMQNVQALYEGAEMYGLSIHIYGAEGNPKTITFDEELINEELTEENPYSWLIGASPDHTDKLSEEMKEDPTRYANIVKFYEVTDPDTGETTYKVFTREKVPETIEIKDEEAETGYQLIEWYTTDKLCTDLSNPEITWEKLWKQDGFDRGKRGPTC